MSKNLMYFRSFLFLKFLRKAASKGFNDFIVYCGWYFCPEFAYRVNQLEFPIENTLSSGNVYPGKVSHTEIKLLAGTEPEIFSDNVLSEAYFGVGIKFAKSNYLTYEYNDIPGYLPVGKS